MHVVGEDAVSKTGWRELLPLCGALVAVAIAIATLGVGIIFAPVSFLFVYAARRTGASRSSLAYQAGLVANLALGLAWALSVIYIVAFLLFE